MGGWYAIYDESAHKVVAWIRETASITNDMLDKIRESLELAYVCPLSIRLLDDVRIREYKGGYDA